MTADETRTRLVRSEQNKVLAGVAGGLANHLNVDPLLIRIAFVLLIFAGGIGFVIYAAAWALIPKEGEMRSVAEVAVDKVNRNKEGTRDNTWIWIVILAIAGLLILANMNRWNWDGGGIIWALILMGAGTWLYMQDLESRKSPRSPAPPAPPAAAPLVVRADTTPMATDSVAITGTESGTVATGNPGTSAGESNGNPTGESSGNPSSTPSTDSGSNPTLAGESVETPLVTAPASAATVTQPLPVQREVIAGPPPPVRARRPRSRLGRYTFAMVLLLVGVAAILDNAGVIEITALQYGGLILAIIGGGLVVGTFFGKSRMLILAGLLLLPLVLSAGLLGSWIDMPLQSGAGDRAYSPASAQELQDTYELTAGTLNLDLTQMRWGTQPVEVDATVTFGEVNVLVPQGVEVDVEGRAIVGIVRLFDDERNGFGVTYHRAADRSPGEPLLILHLKTAAGQVDVARSPSQAREL
ncbi:MAG: PspC domain-containing protein [Actinomycetota bacterium]